MNLREIRRLIKLVENSEIGELEIVEEGKKLRISKNSRHESNGVVAINPPMMNYAASVPVAPQVPTAAIASESSATPDTSSEPEYHEVRSPMVGTFYRSPSPEADPYIEVGQNVGQMTLQRLGCFNYWLKPTMGGPEVPTLEVFLGVLRVAVVPEAPQGLFDRPSSSCLQVQILNITRGGPWGDPGGRTKLSV